MFCPYCGSKFEQRLARVRDVTLTEKGLELLEQSPAAARRHFQDAIAENPKNYQAWRGILDSYLNESIIPETFSEFRPLSPLRIIDFLDRDISIADFSEKIEWSEWDKKSQFNTVPVIYRYATLIPIALCGPLIAYGYDWDTILDPEKWSNNFQFHKVVGCNEFTLSRIDTALVMSLRYAPEGERELLERYKERFVDYPRERFDELIRYCMDTPVTKKAARRKAKKERFEQKREAELSAKSGGDGKAAKRGCYIATAVYGSYSAPEVRVLRRFRDETLARSLPGRLFIRAYYRVSPPIAERLKTARRANALVRRALDKWVARLERRR
jgi:hypothetical protein